MPRPSKALYAFMIPLISAPLGAAAADLGIKKPTAVEYVKTCPTYGAGFFVVPGTTSCLKLIGRVRFEYLFDNPRTRADNANRFRARGYVGFDHRTATEYGLIRTYVRAFFQRQNGGDSTGLEYAYIQFGGLTVGRITPVFEHGWSQFYAPSGYGYHSDLSYINSLGYTFRAGGGFSATLAIDDSRERRLNGLNSLVVPAGPLNGSAGARMPDLVGSLNYDANWGVLKLSGAAFQVRPAGIAGQGNPSTKYGYAAEAFARFNLPLLGKGSNLWVNGGFAQGSTSYNGFSAFTLGSYSVTPVDYVVPAGSNATKLTTSFALMGALQVFVTPTIAVSIGASHASFDPFGANNTVKTTAVLGQLAWLPVAGFTIGLEGSYRKLTFDSGSPIAITTLAGSGGTQKHDVTGRLRVQRDF